MRHVTPILIIHLALIALLTGCATPTGGDSAGTGPTQASDATSEPGSLDGDLRTRYANGAVAADSKPASEAGVEILKAGGNAVDAAIATALTLSVTRPYSCGIGGGGFMIIFVEETGESRALDYRETCPMRVGPDFYAKLPATASGYDPSLYHVFKMTTNEASTRVEDGSLDFIYLDAGHMYKDVMEDQKHWWPKLKKVRANQS